VIDDVWSMILSFSGYSFCKGHSASYIQVALQSGYLRAHYPAEFIAGVLSNEGGYYAPFAYIAEARRMGLAILPPDVNASAVRYTGRDRSLRIGLMALKGLSASGLATLTVERERGAGPTARSTTCGGAQHSRPEISGCSCRPARVTTSRRG
jgi:DNA polymerase III alpha subunit